ncbi:MAG: methyltransferase domain-containing protein [Chloroflexia bacterium]|nr:methyltransferase domain-containing protein [Chloroflexia bacterium]
MCRSIALEARESLMDTQTLAAYEADAARYAAYQRTTAVPAPIRRLVAGFFVPGAPTADIGCGVGRDSAWLSTQGFPTVGIEPSAALRAQAQAAFPGLDLREDALPDLARLPDQAFVNVLCSAVLMHLPAADLIGAALALVRILKPGGRLILAYRGSRTSAEREADGRLFTTIEPGRLVLLLESAGFVVLHREATPDAERDGITWSTLVAERGSLDVARGLDRIQAILAQDRKVATYKFALVRALCTIARTQAHLVRWEGERVLVPLWSIAIQWLMFYWPLLTSPEYIAQMRGEQPGAHLFLSFRTTIAELQQRHGSAGLYDLLAQLDEHPAQFKRELRVLAHTIKVGPVTYAGGGATPIFAFVPPRRPHARPEDRFGWVAVPESIRLDIARFNHWIEDSVILRWARLTARMNRTGDEHTGQYLGLLLQQPGAERDTREAREILHSAGPLRCVWTGEQLGRSFEIDHMVPYVVWGNNDLWNLLPAAEAVNGNKRDRLPSRTVILRRRDAIFGYWHIYDQAKPTRFRAQISRALGCDLRCSGWEDVALAGLQETLERLASSRALARWEP